MWNKGKHQGRGKPIRRIWRCFQRFHPKTGEPLSIPIEIIETELSPEGSPDTTETRVLQFLDCGHIWEHAPTGQCFECRSLSCATCHGQCKRCCKPICLECSKFIQSEVGGERSDRLCRACAEEIRRKEMWTKIGRGVAAIFTLGKTSEGRD